MFVQDGLTDPYYNGPMGIAGDSVALKYNISRLEQVLWGLHLHGLNQYHNYQCFLLTTFQDEYTKQSYARAAAAYGSNSMQWEVVPVPVTDSKGLVSIVDRDEEFTKVLFRGACVLFKL